VTCIVPFDIAVQQCSASFCSLTSSLDPKISGSTTPLITSGVLSDAAKNFVNFYEDGKRLRRQAMLLQNNIITKVL